MKAAEAVKIKEPTNGGKVAIDTTIPYTVACAIEGPADILFHRWNEEAVDEKAKAAKNSKAKKSDDTESYLWRDAANNICIPGEYLRQSIIHAAKFRQDPRSPRKSAMDLFKAGVVSLTNLAPLGKDKPDYFDKRRVMIQRNGINRVRPAMRVGWRAEFDLSVLLPEYISPDMLREVIVDAGRLIGVGDFRPTFGRFSIARFDHT
jgi:hypothetical protein